MSTIVKLSKFSIVEENPSYTAINAWFSDTYDILSLTAFRFGSGSRVKEGRLQLKLLNLGIEWLLNFIAGVVIWSIHESALTLEITNIGELRFCWGFGMRNCQVSQYIVKAFGLALNRGFINFQDYDIYQKITISLAR